MNIELGKAFGPETPAGSAQDYIVEHVSALMAICGIEAISSQKYTCGFGSKLHVSISPFADAPEEISAQGVVIKDALAQIMSVANMTRMVLKPTDSEMNDIRAIWEDSIKASKQINGGSGQDFSGESHGEK